MFRTTNFRPVLAIATFLGLAACSDLPTTPEIAEENPGPVSSPAVLAASAAPTLTQYSSERVALIVGPQVTAGSGANPWLWYDKIALAKGVQHGQNYPISLQEADKGELTERNYYDLGLTLYTAYHRTGDAQYLELARKVTDMWWQSGNILEGTERKWGSAPAPRNASLGGLMLRAMDGRPEMWDWITVYTRAMYKSWLGRRLERNNLWYGVRDGGYTLLYSAWLAQVHPNAKIRAEFRAMALEASTEYYARLQQADGGWYWNGANVPGVYTPDSKFSQPFQIGILLEGLIATHQMSGDARVAQTILKATDWLYQKGYRSDMRGMWYFVLENGRGIGAKDVKKVREVRQLNATTIHTFGYAYKLSGNRKYLEQGDEIFAATFGKGQGPGADKDAGLADAREKEYNESYRSSGRYLAWRAGAR